MILNTSNLSLLAICEVIPRYSFHFKRIVYDYHELGDVSIGDIHYIDLFLPLGNSWSVAPFALTLGLPRPKERI